MARTLLFTNSIENTYKETAKAINEVNFDNRVVIRKTLVEMMKQSFFTGRADMELILLHKKLQSVGN